MIEKFEIVIALVFLLMSILCVFHARGIVKNRFLVKEENLNKAVNIFKIICFIIIVTLLVWIYYLQ